MTLLPIFLKLEGRVCLVVGAGSVAAAKIESLLPTGAVVRVVAPAAHARVRDWAARGLVTWEARAFVARDLAGIDLVIAATSAGEVNRQVFEAARQLRVWCNAVDDPPNCDFFYGAVVRRGDLQIAISTAGQSPALAQRLREELEAQFSPEYADWVHHLGQARERLFASPLEPEQRRLLLQRMVRDPEAKFSRLQEPKEGTRS